MLTIAKWLKMRITVTSSKVHLPMRTTTSKEGMSSEANASKLHKYVRMKDLE